MIAKASRDMIATVEVTVSTTALGIPGARHGRPARITTTLQDMRRLRPLVLCLGVAAGFVAALIVLPHSPGGLRELLGGTGVLAALILLAAWALLIPALFPGTVLAAAGGLAFGALKGAGLAWAGAVIGALVAFALARTLARTPAERLLGPRLRRLRSTIERRGFTAVLLARLTPGVPANGLHYAAGLSRVRARDFAAALALGSVVRTVPYAVLGAGLGTGSITTLALAGGSLVLSGAIAVLLVARLRGAPAV